MDGKSELPDFPQEFPHIFVDVAFDLLPEISYGDLVYLSQLVKQAGRKKPYRSLVDCLRKIQWAKLAGLEAIMVERRIAEQASPEVIPFDPVGQVQHAKALFDFVSHAKASLDSLALFFNSLLGLGQEGGQCDFRRPTFFRLICERDSVIGKQLTGLRIWLDKSRAVSDSIIATRDEWLHRGSPAVQAMFPPSDIGYLPVPKALKGGFPRVGTPLSSDYYWTTPEFVKFHFEKLTALFGTVVARCIQLEEAKAPKRIERNSLKSLVLHPISALPMRGTRDTTLRQMRVRDWVPVFLDAEKLMEGLPQKLLRSLKKEEADIFAKLAKYRTFSARGREQNFVLVTTFLEDSLGIGREWRKLLQEIGLTTDGQLTLSQGEIFICGFRGFMVSWSDTETKVIPVVSLTRLGRELSRLVRIECDDSYTRSFICMMNANGVDVKLIAISDFQGTTFRYDDLGMFKCDQPAGTEF